MESQRVRDYMNSNPQSFYIRFGSSRSITLDMKWKCGPSQAKQNLFVNPTTVLRLGIELLVPKIA